MAEDKLKPLNLDSVYRMRSLGVASSGLPDQYADGKAAKVWQAYIGDKDKRTSQYKEWLIGKLKEHNCKTVLDCACGTGVDSVMLVEEGFEVTSCDASDKMIKHALKERWNRRKEDAFDKWVIEEANWLSLREDLEEAGGEKLSDGWDAVLCLGNSFAHLPDFEDDQGIHRAALSNFAQMVKPGGILLIDHRNYDAILDTGSVPAKNIYYDSDHIVDIKVSNLYVSGQPKLVTLDYYMDVNQDKKSAASSTEASSSSTSGQSKRPLTSYHHFRLSYFPHRLASFTSILKGAFGGENECQHTVFGDFQPYSKDYTPAYFIHSIKKSK